MDILNWLWPLREKAEIRSLHPYAYMSGDWGRITGVVKYDGRECYRICWPTGTDRYGKVTTTVDYWPVDDPDDEREFR